MSKREGKRGFVAPQAALSVDALWERRKAAVEEACAKADAAWDVYFAAMRRAEAESPPPEDILIMKHDGRGHRFRTTHCTEDDIRKACVWYRAGFDFKKGEERALRLIGLAQAWEKQRAKALKRHRVKPLWEERGVAIEARRDARKVLAATPAPNAAALAEKVSLCMALWDGNVHAEVCPLAIGEAMAGDAADGDGLTIAIYLDAFRLAHGDAAVSELIQQGREAYAADVPEAEAEAAQESAPYVDEDGFSAREFWHRAKELGAFFYHDRGVYGWRFPQPPTDAAKAMHEELRDDPSRREAVSYVARTEFLAGAND